MNKASGMALWQAVSKIIDQLVQWCGEEKIADAGHMQKSFKMVRVDGTGR